MKVIKPGHLSKFTCLPRTYCFWVVYLLGGEKKEKREIAIMWSAAVVQLLSIFYSSIWDYKFLAITPAKTLFLLLLQKGIGNGFQFVYFNIYSSSSPTLGICVVWGHYCGLMEEFSKILSITSSAWNIFKLPVD